VFFFFLTAVRSVPGFFEIVGGNGGVGIGGK
jgi:hypothetical protein